MAKKGTDSSITIKDIATMCGVSISTVSNVLNGKNNKVSDNVCKKVYEVVEKTKYRPNYLAKSLRAVSTKTIGVIAEDLILFSTPSIIEGIMNACEEEGYNVVIENMRLFARWGSEWLTDDELFQSALQPALIKMEAMNVDGIIYIGGHEHKVRNLKSNNNTPIVMVYSSSEDDSISTFQLDDIQGGYDAIEYLFSMGHKNIGIITGEADNTHTINRLIGVKNAYADNGLDFNPVIVSNHFWSKQGGYSGMKELLEKNITAVFCMSDTIATGAYAALKENNLEPGKDISVIGFDNQTVSHLITPELTTMALPLREIGYNAILALVKMCEGQTDGIVKNLRMRPELIERDSVKKI